MPQTVTLDPEEWQRILSIIAQTPWATANPLLMKIGSQLQQQQSGNSREMPAAEAQLKSSTQ